MYTKKKSWPRIEQWGIPQDIVLKPDCLPFTWHVCFRSAKQEARRLSALSLMPQASSSSSKSTWFTVSKTFSRSRKSLGYKGRDSCMLQYHSFEQSSKAETVGWEHLEPSWCSYNKISASQYSTSCLLPTSQPSGDARLARRQHYRAVRRRKNARVFVR